MFEILVLNDISPAGLARLPADRYRVGADVAAPDAVLVRSFDMHGFALADSVKAVARAGAGVNNIPYEALAKRGIPVFNAPGANANAVKELTLAGMLLAARNVCAAWEFARSLEGDDEAITHQVEEGKRRFVGFELPGRTLGVIGLGAVGVLVANAALELGMRVVGYDPEITVRRAWQLDAEVRQAESVADLLGRADLVTLHVPLNEHTRHLIGARGLGMMRDGATVLNFSRDGIVDDEAVLAALDTGRLHAYVCDFPSRRLMGHPRVIALPHIGASTREAEENCAVMVAEQLRDYLEDGNIRHSVNFPEVVIPRNEGYRVAVVNANVPNMLGQISTALANAGLNIVDMLNRSRGEIAYTLADVEAPVPKRVVAEIAAIEGVMSVRSL
ncbi:MAG: phosphoglycerate dehydrogenase [Gammaproteobacteria bacterium]|nr:phosphoglycerate dehydrogenase [Gammaproteobacteria bacterium]